MRLTLPLFFAWAMVAAMPLEAREATPSAVRMTLPPYVRIQYQVTWGEGGLVVGSVVQESRHDATSFSLRNTAETTGLARLLKHATVVTVSEGDIVAGGLRPRRFRIERSSGKNESASLDWPSNRVSLSNGRQFELQPGTQDMLSLFVQLPLLDTSGSAVSIPVITTKKIDMYVFVPVGREKIATPRGERDTLHFRHREPDSKEATEIWIGLDDARLPIKIRHVDRRGSVFDQLAVRIDFEETREGTR